MIFKKNSVGLCGYFFNNFKLIQFNNFIIYFIIKIELIFN